MTNFNNDQEKLDQIDLYIKGNLSEEAKTTFEQKLLQDKEFAGEVEQYKSAANLVKEYAIHQELKSFHENFIQDKDTDVVPIFSKVKYIAAVLVLIVSGVLIQASLINKDNIFDEQQLFSYKSRNIEESNISELLAEYYDGNLEVVIEKYQQSSALKNNSKASFYAGNAYLGLNKPSEAKICFNRVINNLDKSANLSQNAEWYLALSELKSENYAQALALFEQIKNNNNHLYSDQISGWQIMKLRILKIKG